LKITKSYIIFTTPRTVSSLLCADLCECRKLGMPAEHLWRDESKEEKMDPSALRNAVLETLENSEIFGSKIMLGNDTFQELESITNLMINEFGSPFSCLSPHSEDSFFIFLFRKNKVRQAISWLRAIQSNRWFETEDTLKTKGETRLNDTYDFYSIQYLINEIKRREKIFIDRVNFQKKPYLTIESEYFIKNREETISLIKDFLGIDTLSIKLNKTLLKQSDSVNDDWEIKFQSDLISL